MKSRRPLLLIVVSALALRFLLMPVLPLVDTTEGRYAVVAQEMALTDDWVTPKVWIEGELIPFLGKPPLFFWLAAGSMKLFGINELSARLPSWLAMLGVVALMGFILRRFVDERTSWLAMALTLACPVFLGLGGAVATDMLLAAFVAGAVLVYLAFALETEKRLRRRWSLLLFTLLAGGFLTKGPVALALFGMPVLAWTILYRKWDLLRDHAWGRGILLFLALVVPWFWLCEIRNPGFLEYFFVNENFLRFVTPNYGDRYGNGHIFPRGSALVMLFLATMPWSPYALWLGWRRRRDVSLRPSNQMVGLLFLGFLVPTLFWCLARQLLITYLLPMVPLFCAWLALVLPRGGLLQRRPGRVIGAVLGTVAVLGCTLGPMVCADRSAKGIVTCGQRRVGSMLIFTRRVPYSAYFYGRGSVLPHPKWPVAQATRLALSMGDSAVLVMKDYCLEDIPDEMAPHVRQVAAAGKYVLLVPEDQSAQLSASECRVVGHNSTPYILP